MANVSHASLTGSELHEPKGITTAAAGTVYVSNGSGSGTWSSVGTSAFTGVVADFLALSAPAGWLELDGSTISTTTYAALYGVMSLTTSGTRSNGSAVITSIPDTSNLRAGYYAFGTGIASGTTILSVDSAAQVTLSGNASSSGSGTIVFSPWLLNTGTIQLPDVKTAGRYRRSRSGTNKIGDVLADQNQAHTHSVNVSTTTSTTPDHFHSAGIYDPGHAHTYNYTQSGGNQGGGGAFGFNITTASTSTSGTGVRVNSSNGIDTTYSAGSHNHSVNYSGNTGSVGGTEARPVSLVLITCVKT